MGKEPSHPELLDWLAVWFRDGGGSFKQLHRLLVMSSAYRQSSSPDTTTSALAHRQDQGNTLLWRMPRRRLEAEAIRDTMLAVSGKLDLAMGGPSVRWRCAGALPVDLDLADRVGSASGSGTAVRTGGGSGAARGRWPIS